MSSKRQATTQSLESLYLQVLFANFKLQKHVSKKKFKKSFQFVLPVSFFNKRKLLIHQQNVFSLYCEIKHITYGMKT